MASKQIELPEIGTVNFVKRRGAKSIRVTINADSSVRVTLPPWVPYQAGIAFARSKKDWIKTHQRPSKMFAQGELIGKAHRLLFVPVATSVTKSRINGTEIRISYPTQQQISSPSIQAIAEKAARRALKKQAEALLFRRLEDLAHTHGFRYKSVSVKRLKSRWGSCGPQADVTLNIFLMQLPWQLIDYVLIHELVHTKVHNHGQDFWNLFETVLPDAKKYRKQLRTYQPAF